ncbi:TPA: phage major capsid protein, partial [Klebsiella pneumoniae]|nr:phage major capsid protein [Klebsiella pneumoniae]
MPLLREEAEKLSNNELEQGVIETIIDRDDLFAVLPFMKINSKAYLYNREKTL